MNYSREIGASTDASATSFIKTLAGPVLRVLARCAYGASALIGVPVMAALYAIAAILLVTTLFYGLVSFAHPTHFPFLTTLVWMGVCVVAAIAYRGLMEWLRSLGSRR